MCMSIYSVNGLLRGHHNSRQVHSRHIKGTGRGGIFQTEGTDKASVRIGTYRTRWNVPDGGDRQGLGYDHCSAFPCTASEGRMRPLAAENGHKGRALLVLLS